VLRGVLLDANESGEIEAADSATGNGVAGEGDANSAKSVVSRVDQIEFGGDSGGEGQMDG